MSVGYCECGGRFFFMLTGHHEGDDTDFLQCSRCGIITRFPAQYAPKPKEKKRVSKKLKAKR